ncbi:MAG: hypothetical protein R3F14_04855 [Polyangiaceae bacterium]
MAPSLFPDGSVDTSKVVGVDADLVVKPFGWKGSFATLRDAAEDALLIHFGMQSDYLVSTAGAERTGPFGGIDPDGDGITSEIAEGQVTALTLFLAMQETPQQVPPQQSEIVPLLAEGIAKFQSLGCATCHVPSLPVKSPVFRMSGRDSPSSLSVDLSREAAMPRLTPSAQTGVFEVRLYSDLAPRHGRHPGRGP